MVSIIGRWRGNNLVWRFQEGRVKHFCHDKKLRAWIGRNMNYPWRHVDVVRRNQTEAYWEAWKKRRGIHPGRVVSKFVYTLNFWNPENDQEINVWFEAGDWFEAEDIGNTLGIKGYKKGVVTYAEDWRLDSGYANLDQLRSNQDFYNPAGDVVQA